MSTQQMSLRKAQKLWGEFPFLWGITQSWCEVQTFRVQRLDRDALLMIINPERHDVFLHKQGLRFDGGGWEDFLSEVRYKEWESREKRKERALVDLLNFSGHVPIHRDERNNIREIIVVERACTKKDANGHPIIPLYRERVFTIYKPPRLKSITTLVLEVSGELFDLRRLPT